MTLPRSVMSLYQSVKEYIGPKINKKWYHCREWQNSKKIYAYRVVIFVEGYSLGQMNTTEIGEQDRKIDND